MMTQLNPPIPLFIPRFGQTGLAHLVIDYSPEFDVIWGVILDRGGEIWWLKNSEVRGVVNFTMGRKAL